MLSWEQRAAVNRRTFLGRTSAGMGALTLGSLLNPAMFSRLAGAATVDDTSKGAVHPLHLPPRAKRVIFLYMSGGPSHLETFDYKPELAKQDGKPMPESFTKGQPIAQLQGQKLSCLGPRFSFRKFGNSGQEMSELFPHIGSIADEIAIVRSMQTDQINHDPAHTVMNTGTSISGRPSMGSWVTYGLGSESDNLPGFVVLTSSAGRTPQPISSRQWHSGFLPSRFQGVPLYSKGDPAHYVRNPHGVDADRQHDVIATIGELDRFHNELVRNPEIDTRISQYELAFRMQMSVPQLMDFSDEPKAALELYGAKPGDGSFASNCLLARRLAERGVRFIQLYHREWDHHARLEHYIKECALLTDGPSAALVKDLKQRGMLDDTLIVWGGEFGRTPMGQADKGPIGRDHHIRAFSMWMAGGGIKGGVTHGATDELGYAAVQDVVHVHDLHATMLHLLGIDDKRLTVRYQGRDFRLTDVHGNVVSGILA
jgi:hypothetical protein